MVGVPRRDHSRARGQAAGLTWPDLLGTQRRATRQQATRRYQYYRRHKTAVYDHNMKERKAELTVTIDPHLAAYAQRLVAAGTASSISAVINDALSEKERRDRCAVDHLKEIAAQADPAKVARMMAHIDAQAAELPER